MSHAAILGRGGVQPLEVIAAYNLPARLPSDKYAEEHRQLCEAALATTRRLLNAPATRPLPTSRGGYDHKAIMSRRPIVEPTALRTPRHRRNTLVSASPVPGMCNPLVSASPVPGQVGACWAVQQTSSQRFRSKQATRSAVVTALSSTTVTSRSVPSPRRQVGQAKLRATVAASASFVHRTEPLAFDAPDGRLARYIPCLPMVPCDPSCPT